MVDKVINGRLGAAHVTTSLQSLYTAPSNKQAQGMLEITCLEKTDTVYFGVIIEDSSGNQYIKNEHIPITNGQTLRHPISVREADIIKVYCESMDAALTSVTATKANPVVVTVTDTSGVTANEVYSISGMTEFTGLNDNIYKVGNITSTTMELRTLDGQDLDGTGLTGTAETTGGTLQKVPLDIIFLGFEEDVPQQ